jgi:polyhydroxyalkanoate synthesis regulator phasin
MDEPAEPTPTDDSEARSLREVTERFLLAGLGLLSATKEHAQDALGATGEGPQLRDRASATLGSVLDEAGFVRKDRYDELELKVAQLEHRLRLLEDARPPGAERPA